MIALISEMLIGLMVLPLVLMVAVFWVWMVIDCVTKESNQGNDRIVWLILILGIHVLGAAIYYFVRRPQRIAELGR